MSEQITPRDDSSFTSDYLCEQCRHIDLDSICFYQRYYKRGIHIYPTLKCVLCLFFARVLSYPRYPAINQPVFTEFRNIRLSSPGRSLRLLWETSNNHGRQLLPTSGGGRGAERLPSVEYGQLLEEERADFGLMRKWINDCDQTPHPWCSVPQFSDISHEIPGIRLIDCETRRVIIAKGACKFVALSYVWGQDQVKTPRSLLRSGTDKLPLINIPQTINDAIEVTQRLKIPGLRYLWVDQYCIDQTNETEKNRQISQMDMIYKVAFLTIIAASGEDSSYGLPGISRNRVKQPRITLRNSLWVSRLTPLEEISWHSKWFTRGWTYQEGVFSHRRLIFTDEQVWFECNDSSGQKEEVIKSEFGGYKMLIIGGELTPHQSDQNLGSLWRHIEQYSKRDLSFPGDVLNGLGGIFRAFFRMERRPICQFWGIPLDIDKHSLNFDAGFAHELLWGVGDLKPQRGIKRRRGFPSWSWAGWEGFEVQEPRRNYEPEDAAGLHESETPTFSAQVENDGRFERLTRVHIESVNGDGDMPMPYTCMLKVSDVWVADVNIEVLPCNTFSGDERSGYWIRSSKCEDPDGYEDRICWQLRDILIDLSSELGGSANSATHFSCIFFSMANQPSQLGLILITKPGLRAERIASVWGYSSRVWLKKKALVVDSPEEVPRPYLSDHFPFKRQTIFLG
ncbi:heterokaryon incompatibility protein-domain-containing protein [Podospora fimiseda]|uniref:Heterokaryon incompatibility protein-domain-containing protein n=1 Tax=Podospora fimiseda TaxID=252190 RepID=A0AAN6YP32_9PEZI|nr:heterokaryon incompatibility protein-domain-containing protein [Podospora fimiseda]